MTREDALISIGRIQNTMEMMLNEVNRYQAKATYAAHLAQQAQVVPPAPPPVPVPVVAPVAPVNPVKNYPMIGFSNRAIDPMVFSPGANVRNI